MGAEFLPQSVLWLELEASLKRPLLRQEGTCPPVAGLWDWEPLIARLCTKTEKPYWALCLETNRPVLSFNPGRLVGCTVVIPELSDI